MAGQKEAQVEARIDDGSAVVSSKQLERELLELLAKKIDTEVHTGQVNG